MEHDSIICWYCEKMSMEPAPELGHGWRQCSRCGATLHPNPTAIGPPIITTEKITKGYRAKKFRPVRLRKPKAPAKAS